MPTIGDASALTLGNMAHQLNLGAATPGKELRSTGTDLYVKDGPAMFTKLASRLSHQQSAVALVRDGLAREHHVSGGDADRILANVFGAPLTQVRVADVQRLQALGATATQVHGGGGVADMVGAFQVAAHVAPLEALHLGHADALVAAREVQALVDAGRPLDAAITAVATSARLRSGHITATQARTLLTSGPERGAFLQSMGTAMAALPAYGAAGGAQRTEWLRIANAFGSFVPTDRTTALPTGQKASMLHALSDKVLERAGANDMAGTRTAYRAVMKLNEGITLAELRPASEQLKTTAFHASIRNNQILQDARRDWGTLGADARGTAINELIRLHSAAFGYAVPQDYLRLEAMAPDEAGGLNPDGTMVINTACADFGNFALLFNTVVHESTHKYQHHLTAVLPGDDRAGQAQVFAANQKALVLEAVLAGPLGIPQDEAHNGYRGQPMEQHAYRLGDESQALIPQLFA